MMASFMSYLGTRKDPKQAVRDAIVNLRQQLQMTDKEYLPVQNKIEEETQANDTLSLRHRLKGVFSISSLALQLEPTHTSSTAIEYTI
jgi:hypothetical protein